jgi:hypothetical protein
LRLTFRGLQARRISTWQCCGAEKRASQQNPLICAARHRFRASEQPF